MREPCELCDGQGVIESLHEAGVDEVCTTCGGTGEKPQPLELPEPKVGDYVEGDDGAMFVVTEIPEKKR